MSIQLTVEVQEAQMILGALAKLPLENSLDTWFKVKAQAEQQLAARQQNPVAEPAPKTEQEPVAEVQPD